MTEILIKRLLSFSRFYLFIFGFSMVALVHRFDSMELQKEIRTLDLMLVVDKVMDEDGIDVRRLQTKAKIWLEKSDTTLAKQHINARQKLVDALKLSGVDETTIAIAKARLPENGEKRDNFSLLDIADVEKDWKEISSPIYGSDDLTLNETLDQFMYLTEPRLLKVVVDVENLEQLNAPTDEVDELKSEDDLATNAFRPAARSFASPEPFRPFGSESRASMRVNFDGDDVLITQVEPLSSIVQQSSETETVTRFPAKIETLTGPSIYGLLKEEKEEFTAIRNDTERLTKLRQLYGNMKFDMAQQIIAGDYSQAYKNISVFGFSFSTRRYPFAVLFFSICVSIGIFSTLRDAHREKLALFSKAFQEDTIYTLIRKKYGRILLWVVLPVVAVMASFPIYALSQSELLVIGLGVMLIMIFGVSSFLLSKKLL